jgi:hypothetical protein
MRECLGRAQAQRAAAGLGPPTPPPEERGYRLPATQHTAAAPEYVGHPNSGGGGQAEICCERGGGWILGWAFKVRRGPPKGFCVRIEVKAKILNFAAQNHGKKDIKPWQARKPV